MTGSSESTMPFPYHVDFLNSGFEKESLKDENIVPCESSEDLLAYLNQVAVQNALHVKLSLAPKWVQCNNTVINEKNNNILKKS